MRCLGIEQRDDGSFAVLMEFHIEGAWHRYECVVATRREAERALAATALAAAQNAARPQVVTPFDPDECPF